MSEVIDIDKKQTEGMLHRYKSSGQEAFNEALATPDSEVSQDAFDRFANGSDATVTNLPVVNVGHVATSSAEKSAQVLQFPKP